MARPAEAGSENGQTRTRSKRRRSYKAWVQPRLIDDSVDISLWTRHPECVRWPNSADAVISSEKIREYLLSKKHPIGMHKASFFEALGYTEAHWRRLGEDLRRIVTIGDAEPSRHNGYGQLFVVDGKLDGPSGKAARVRTIWIILDGDGTPRLVTVYPGDRDEV